MTTSLIAASAWTTAAVISSSGGRSSTVSSPPIGIFTVAANFDQSLLAPLRSWASKLRPLTDAFRPTESPANAGLGGDGRVAALDRDRAAVLVGLDRDRPGLQLGLAGERERERARAGVEP